MFLALRVKMLIGLQSGHGFLERPNWTRGVYQINLHWFCSCRCNQVVTFIGFFDVMKAKRYCHTVVSCATYNIFDNSKAEEPTVTTTRSCFHLRVFQRECLFSLHWRDLEWRQISFPLYLPWLAILVCLILKPISPPPLF